MSIERINPGELARPSGFSHAVVATGGQLVFLAGQAAVGPDGQVSGNGVVEQFARALANLLAALRAAGGGPANLASMTAFIVDMDDYRAHSQEIGEVWRRLAGRDYPAMAAVGVHRLWDPGLLVELQAIAVVPTLNPRGAGTPERGGGPASS
jgi:enamine deaminase RidA (YjgF/YER057c/UK114 family)